MQVKRTRPVNHPVNRLPEFFFPAPDFTFEIDQAVFFVKEPPDQMLPICRTLVNLNDSIFPLGFSKDFPGPGLQHFDQR